MIVKKIDQFCDKGKIAFGPPHVGGPPHISFFSRRKITFKSYIQRDQLAAKQKQKNKTKQIKNKKIKLKIKIKIKNIENGIFGPFWIQFIM